MNCCEVWNYAIKPAEFKMSSNQKKTMKRFHNYLNYGSIHAPDHIEDPRIYGGINLKCTSNHRMKVQIGSIEFDEDGENICAFCTEVISNEGTPEAKTARFMRCEKCKEDVCASCARLKPAPKPPVEVKKER